GNDVYVFSGASNGNDTIVETPNRDSDSLDFSAFPAGIAVDLNLKTVQHVAASLDLTLSSSTGLENIKGSQWDDTLTANSRDNELVANDGNDAFIVPANAPVELPDSVVVGRQVFYKGSAFDDDGFGGPSHDQAIASDKVALLPGAGLATF